MKSQREMIHISIIEPIGGHGGNDIYDFNLVRAINLHENYNALLYTCDETSANRNTDVKLFYKNIYGSTNKYIRGFHYIKGTLCSLFRARRERSDIVHLHFYDFSHREYFNLYMAKRVFRFYVVGTIHDVESFEKYARGDNRKHNYNKFLGLLDGVVVHTEFARKELIMRTTYENMNHARIRVIYDCDLDYDTFEDNYMEKNIARQHLNLPQDKDIILFFGQIKKVKGLDVLLDSLFFVKRKIPNVLLVIAGKVWKDDFSIYEEIIKRKALASYIEKRIRYIKNDEVPFYFNAADVIALPYRKIYNSGVLIRAMSFGVPVVASNFGPFTEFISDGDNGFLFETDNAESLAIKLVTILKHPDLLKSISKKERAFIMKNFSLSVIGSQYCDFYDSILGNS